MRQHATPDSTEAPGRLHGYWRRLQKAFFAPGEGIDRATLADLQERAPTPVVWLLGKAQSGKTSLVRALTGRDDVEIGDGYRACTKSAQLYEFPTPDHCLARFLDTRGLGEVEYDPAEDLALFQRQAHLLVVVMRAMDHSQGGVLDALHLVRKAHPEWPTLVVQTCLHDGYPDAAFDHPSPYPFSELSSPLIPEDLRRSLLKQREWFRDIPGVRFAALDLTHVADGYSPYDYGVDALWSALEAQLPIGMRNIFASLRAGTEGRYLAAAHPHILGYALLAAAAEATPLPLVGLTLVISIQAKLFHSLAHIYGQPLDARRFAEVAGLLGSGFVLRLAGREIAKVIPVWGQALAAVYAGAVTYALGRALCLYFERLHRGEPLDPESFEREFAEQMAEARRMLGKGERGEG